MINSPQKNKQGAFIALISAIIISVLLLIITVSTSLTGIFGRFNVLDSESKERSVALAEACADTAILETTTGIYGVDEEKDIGPTIQDKCTIVSAELDEPAVGQTLIKTQSGVNKAYTNLRIVIDGDYSIISWEECTNLTNLASSC
jgi:hypothetical protein